MHSAAILAGFSLILAACDGSTIHKTSSLGEMQTLSLDAKQRLVIVGTRRVKGEIPRQVVCAEPSPDALVAQAAVLSASGNYAGPKGSTNAAGNLGVGFQESAASIGLRTQSIQILRDGYYRLCEAYLNGAIATEEYQRVTLNLDTFINVALAIDGLGNAKSAPAVAIGTGPITVNGGTSETTDPNNPNKTPATPNVLNIGATPDPKIVDAGKGGFDRDVTPIAVAQIVRDFLNYKEDIACIESFSRTCRKLPTAPLSYPKITIVKAQ